ncbi:hypothetical protein DIE14_01530 [Burkholderia sp. Bp9017]|uniref:hypothetical protein n=1 Tax=Burkholderia TaxID=32008 RepID=UPI000F5E0D0D|nr:MULTISPECIES: hypothetical protein [Burkholderia]RQZ31623.1 hypothetical protein DIE14_01530 [Burkholderia sp. Bp9017]RQZ37754.1 hypothetical protein DIE13_01520 [Burkholderia sp. Bp9016]
MKRLIMVLAALAATNAAYARDSLTRSAEQFVEQLQLGQQGATLDRVALASAERERLAAEQRIDDTRFCYYAGQAFSAGAVLNGMRCDDPHDSVAVVSGVARRLPTYKLRWISVKVSAAAGAH